MRIHFLQHAACDGPGNIPDILETGGHTLTTTLMYKDGPLPSKNDLDWLIILGGDMGVHDEDQHPWLSREKAFIREIIDAGKRVLGLCLGAQLIADVLGAGVRQNPYKEVGWFPVTPLNGIDQTILSGVIEEEKTLFHWHQDTFDLPQGAVAIASSRACPNQGFVRGNRIIGLQFHPEIRKEDAWAFLRDCGEHLGGGPYVQTPDAILANETGFAQSKTVMAGVLSAMEAAGD